jgi:hypothetical protein
MRNKLELNLMWMNRSLFKSKTELTIVRNKVFAMAEPWLNQYSTMQTTNHSLANRSQFINHPWSNHCKIFVLQSRKYVASFLPQIISKKLIWLNRSGVFFTFVLWRECLGLRKIEWEWVFFYGSSFVIYYIGEFAIENI